MIPASGGRIPGRADVLDVRGGVPGDDGGEAVRLALQALPQVQEDEGRLRRVVLQALWQGVLLPEGAGMFVWENNVILSEFDKWLRNITKLTEPPLLPGTPSLNM